MTDSDFNPIYDLIEVIAEVAEDITGWYEDVVGLSTEGADWVNWFNAATSGGSSLEDQDASERSEFTDWLNTISFHPKYFKFSSSGIVKKINKDADYKSSDVLELLSIQLEALSTNASQVLIFTEALIDDYNDSSQEVKDLVDSLRSAGEGHVSW